MIDTRQRVDTLRLDDALEEVRAVADSIETDTEYRAGMRTGLTMALRLIELRVNHP